MYTQQIAIQSQGKTAFIFSIIQLFNSTCRQKKRSKYYTQEVEKKNQRKISEQKSIIQTKTSTVSCFDGVLCSIFVLYDVYLLSVYIYLCTI